MAPEYSLEEYKPQSDNLNISKANLKFTVKSNLPSIYDGQQRVNVNSFDDSIKKYFKQNVPDWKIYPKKYNDQNNIPEIDINITLSRMGLVNYGNIIASVDIVNNTGDNIQPFVVSMETQSRMDAGTVSHLMKLIERESYNFGIVTGKRIVDTLSENKNFTSAIFELSNETHDTTAKKYNNNSTDKHQSATSFSIGINSSDPETMLKEIKKLYDDDLITKEEYEMKRKYIIEKL